jgi:hypothetical protein
MAAMRELSKNKAPAPGLLSHRNAEIKAPWCPATGNMFATPADQEKRAASRARSAAQGLHKGPAAKCTGACRGTP